MQAATNSKLLHAIYIRVTLEGLESPTYTQRLYVFNQLRRQQWLLLILFCKAVVKGGGPGYIIDKFRHQANIHSHL